MQSNLRERIHIDHLLENDGRQMQHDAPILIFPELGENHNKMSRRQQFYMLQIYIAMCALAFGLFNAFESAAIKAFALGLLAPGAGMLFWAGSENPSQLLAVLSALIICGFFAASIVVWIGTGNILLPPIVWIGGALIAAVCNGVLAENNPGFIWRIAHLVIPVVLLAVFAVGFAGNSYARKSAMAKREKINEVIRVAKVQPAIPNKPAQQELSIEDLQRMRLILDRALQPIDSFEGFEWIDQFQTSAVRYQLNFMSYGLSMVQANFLPAFSGYLNTAQQNLATKLQNHSVWRYWRLENMWGNLQSGSDPMPRDNIMYSGFMAAQLAYFQNVSGSKSFEAPRSISCAHPCGEKHLYSLPEITKLLAGQYRDAKYGLVACEPNWIYPLCNFITASGIRTHDTSVGTSRWDEMEKPFREHLEQEFIRADGRIVPFRSSYTGIGVPQVGGAVIQAFPCLFLITILPDIAQRQWAVFKDSLRGDDLRKTCWPIDVGNYGYSRAASYVATAAAAREMGDNVIAAELLECLEDECPTHINDGVAHRENASIWAHSVEFLARCSSEGALNKIVTSPSENMNSGLFVKKANYPDVLLAKAVFEGNALSVVVHPGKNSGHHAITIGGLKPRETYVLRMADEIWFKANTLGDAKLNVPIYGRTEFSIFLAEGIST